MACTCSIGFDVAALRAQVLATYELDAPIFNGLAISLIFEIHVSTLLTLVVIPLLCYMAYRNRLGPTLQGVST